MSNLEQKYTEECKRLEQKFKDKLEFISKELKEAKNISSEFEKRYYEGNLYKFELDNDICELLTEMNNDLYDLDNQKNYLWQRSDQDC